MFAAPNCGWAGLPPAFTADWPWKTIDTGSLSVLCSTTVTALPLVTQSVGPGSWKPCPSPSLAKPHE